MPQGHDLDDVPVEEAPTDVELLRFDPGWVRYAPLTSSGNVIAAGLLAVLGQFSEQLGTEWFSESDVRRQAEQLSPAAVIPLVLVAFLVLGALFSLLGYFVANWGFQLARDSRGRSFHVRRGLLTSTETSLERERVRGLSVDEPLGLRLAHAARLYAIVTGVSKSEAGRTQLVPPAPRRVIDETGVKVLETSDPLELTLVQHGPAARRRRWTRALVGAGVLPVAAIALAAATPLTWWVVLPAMLAVPVGAGLAFDRYRRLGHGLSADHLVVRSGSLRGRRDVLQRTGIIGWNIEQSWFQRRAGLVTLVATTAAGAQEYAAIDIPEALAIALADEAVPGLVEPFLA
jgi:putative membrane protein